MNHNEPDHSGSLAKLLELMPNAQLIASIAGANYLKISPTAVIWIFTRSRTEKFSTWAV